MEKVTIMDVAAEGKAIAKVDDLVIFVPYVVPGDVVDLQIKRKKNKYAEAEAVKFHELSPNRAVPFCQHYGVCGGCKWQVLPYSEQIRYKQKQVEDNLRRIGKIELPEISPILGSDKTEFYRNKLEFTFSNKRWLTNEEVRQDVKYDQMNAVGFHIPGAFDKVLAIEKCWLQDDISNRIRNAVRDYAYEHDYSFINLRTQEGMLRNMIIRTSWALSPDGKVYMDAKRKYNAGIIDYELPRLAKRGINFRVSPPGIMTRDGLLLANTAIPNAVIRYTTDGSEPTESSIEWQTPVVCNAPLIKAKAFYLGKESVTTVLFNR